MKSRRPTNVTEGGNLIIHVNFPRRRKRLADRVRLNDRHPEKIHNQVVRRHGERRACNRHPVARVVELRAKEERLPRLIAPHPSRKRTQHSCGLHKAIRRKLDIPRLTEIPSKVSVTAALRSTSLIRLIDESPVIKMRHPVIKIVPFVELLARPRINLWQSRPVIIRRRQLISCLGPAIGVAGHRWFIGKAIEGMRPHGIRENMIKMLQRICPTCHLHKLHIF